LDLKNVKAELVPPPPTSEKTTTIRFIWVGTLSDPSGFGVATYPNFHCAVTVLQATVALEFT
jgi:hypothetical protein